MPRGPFERTGLNLLRWFKGHPSIDEEAIMASLLKGGAKVSHKSLEVQYGTTVGVKLAPLIKKGWVLPTKGIMSTTTYSLTEEGQKVMVERGWV